MDNNKNKEDLFELTPSQTAWVVKDVEKAKIFFGQMFGVTNFSPTVTTRLQDFDGTYYGEMANAENLVTMTYSGGTFIEIMGITKEGEKAVDEMKMSLGETGRSS